MPDLKLHVDDPTGPRHAAPSDGTLRFPAHLASFTPRAGTWHAESTRPIVSRFVDGVAVPVDPFIADVEAALERAEQQMLQLRRQNDETLSAFEPDPEPPRAA